MSRTTHTTQRSADALEVTPDEPSAVKKPVIQRPWIGVLSFVVGFAVGGWFLALLVLLGWAGWRIAALEDEWGSPVSNVVVRTLVGALIVLIIGFVFGQWNPVSAERGDAEPSSMFGGLTTARFETTTGLAGECTSVPSIATLDHTHASAFEAMREAYVDLSHIAATDLRSRIESGSQLVRFGQGDAWLERLAIVAEQTDEAGQTLMVVHTAELFPAVTDGTAGARRARLAPDVSPGDGSRPRSGRVEAVVTMHAWGPCPPGLGLDFWVNATRDPMSSPWDLTPVPIPVAPSPYGD